MNLNILESSFASMIQVYEENVELLKICESKCVNTSDFDFKFISDNVETLRSNEKRIGWYCSIIEETISMATKSADDFVGDSDSVDEEKYRPNKNHSVQEYINLANPHVSFKETVTVVEFPSEVDETNENESSETSLTGETYEYEVDIAQAGIEDMTLDASLPMSSTAVETSSISTSSTNETVKHAKPKLFGFALRKVKRLKKLENFKRKPLSTSLPAPVRKRTMVTDNSDTSERGGRKHLQLKLKRVVTGQCLVCDKRKAYSRMQWQHHLLTHTKENFYLCRQCGQTFRKRHQHGTCPITLLTDIFEQYGCVGEDCLKAFVCDFCDYFRVSERRMMKHLADKHNVKSDRSYKKCNVVTNV